MQVLDLSQIEQLSQVTGGQNEIPCCPGVAIYSDYKAGQFILSVGSSTWQYQNGQLHAEHVAGRWFFH
jgi:hypothetical protein